MTIMNSGENNPIDPSDIPVNDTQNNIAGSSYFALAEKFITREEYSKTISIENIEKLRAVEPTELGEMVMLFGYHLGSPSGGGLFVYDSNDTRSRDDGGMTIVTRRGRRWKRIINSINDVNVEHFGAIADGKTDCVDAVRRMWKWTRQEVDGIKIYESIGIRFPAGRFFISCFDIASEMEDKPWDIARFRIAGESVNFGHHSNTTLVSDEESNYMFRVKARWVELTGLIIDGRSESKGKRNKKGFYQNINPGGQYLRATALSFRNLGGRGLDLLDTLDCKIDQWYASKCHETVIYARWSNQKAGSWDHITAIELSNFNAQYCYEKPVIDLPRAGQSMIWNGWIEHCDYPGDLNNGQWTFTGLNLEDNKNPLLCHYCRIVCSQLNLQSGSTIDYSDKGERFLSKYETGRTFIQNYGIRAEGSLSFDYLSATETLANTTGKPGWFYLGEMEIAKWNSAARIQVVGSAFDLNLSATQKDYDATTTEGEAIISLQNIKGRIHGVWSGKGSCPLTRVWVDSTGSNTGKIYVELNKWTDRVQAFVTTTSPDRFASGVHFRFTKAFERVSAQMELQLNEQGAWCFHQQWNGNNQVGYGFNNDNELLLRATVRKNQLYLRVNGKKYAIDLIPVVE